MDNEEKIQDLLNLPTHELHSRNEWMRKGKPPERWAPRPAFSAEFLLNYLRKNGIRYVKELREIATSENDPILKDYHNIFGSWEKAVRQAYADIPMPSDYDRFYIIKCVVEFNLWTLRDYQDAYKRRPDIIPGLHMVEILFGKWSILSDLARAYSTKETIHAYMKLKEKFGGKVISKKNCAKHGIDLSKVLRIYGSKKKFDDLIKSMENL